MERLQSDLEKIKELAANNVFRNMREKTVQDLSELRISDILPEGYVELLKQDADATDAGFSVRSYIAANGKYGTVSSLQKIENEKLGTFLPWDYLDGPYTFELGGRRKKDVMLNFVKELLSIYGVSDETIKELSARKW